MAYLTKAQYISMSDTKAKQLAIMRGKALLTQIIGVSKDGRLTYNQLALLQTWALQHFTYTPDDVKFKVGDYWDPRAWIEMILTGNLEDDCDGYGYAILGILYYIFGYSKEDVYRVSCATETNGPHFVSWTVDNAGIYYQLENRVKKPRSVKYMRDLGYTYWHYSSMKDVKKWLNAKQKVMNIIYNTPRDLEADKPEFTIEKAFSLDKSKTLIKDWFTVITGSVVTIVNVIRDSTPSIVDTLQANQTNLSQFLDGKTVGMLMVVLGIIGVYLRTITNKGLDQKVNYDK